MMILVYILIGLAVVLVVLALLAPKDARVERSVTVSASPQECYDNIRSLKAFNVWSPWADRDPNMDQGYRGTDGEIGSVHWWKGGKDVGEGEMEVKELISNQKVVHELRFLKPFKATNKAYFHIVEKGAQTEVTWGFYAQFKLPTSIFMIFMKMEVMIGKDYEKGLAKFKTTVES